MMMMAATDRYTPPLSSFISFSIDLTSLRMVFLSAAVMLDLSMSLIVVSRAVSTSMRIFASKESSFVAVFFSLGIASAGSDSENTTALMASAFRYCFFITSVAGGEGIITCRCNMH